MTALGLIPLVPGTRLLGHVDELAGVGRHADDVGDVGRHVDDLGSVGPVGAAGRAIDPPPPRPRPPKGTTYPIDPQARRLVDEYALPDTSPARRAQISEQVGEAGGMSYLRDVTGDPNLPMFRPGTDADVAGLLDDFDAGQPWPHAVTFGGSHATNIVYFDGDTLHIIEAKGGDSAYAMRTSPDPDIPGLSQTDPDYPRVVGSEMLESSKTDGRNTIGRIIGRAYDQDSVRYVGIRTGPASALRAGSPTTVVDGVFLEP